MAWEPTMISIHFSSACRHHMVSKREGCSQVITRAHLITRARVHLNAPVVCLFRDGLRQVVPLPAEVVEEGEGPPLEVLLDGQEAALHVNGFPGRISIPWRVFSSKLLPLRGMPFKRHPSVVHFVRGLHH